MLRFRRVLAALFSSRWSALLPLASFALVVLADGVGEHIPWSILTGGLLDDSAHLATALTALLLFPSLLVSRPLLSLAALTASVAIDLDHLLMYAGLPVTTPGGRPYSHTLVSLLLLLLLLASLPRLRSLCLGLALGLTLHFVRDLAEGPGLALAWPFSTHLVTLPYPVFLSLLLATAITASRRLLRLCPCAPCQTSLAPKM